MPLVCGDWARAGMVDILHRQIQLILVGFPVSAVFRAAIGENTQPWNIVFFIERKHAVMQHVGRYQRILAIVQLGKGHFRVGVDEGLLVNASDALDGADLVGVLRAQLARMLRV